MINEPEHKDLIKKLNSRLYTWPEATNGMKIPLKKDIGVRLDKTRPQ